MFGYRHSSARGLAPTLAVMAALLVSACSSGPPGLSTGSLLSGNKPPPADDPADRAVLAAATSARAAKCGYNFDPAKLRTAYLAYESTQGGAVEQLAKLEKTYDLTRGTVAARLGSSETYCSEDQTEAIKKDLTRNLAGDFALPKKPVVANVTGSSWWGLPASRNDEFNREKIFDPMAARR